MCRSETGVRIRLIVGIGCVLAGGFTNARAQGSPESVWKHVAGTSVLEDLAAPATGPVGSVWYAAGGSRLLARTSGGRVFETTDFEHWRLNTADAAPSNHSASVVQTAGNRLYAAGADNVYASDDSGKTWLNLTGFNDRSVLGGGFTGVAISPSNPQEVVAANRFGVWRSLDSGLSWHGLNDGLPNLGARKLIARRILVLEDSSVVAVDSGAWRPSASTDPEIALRSAVSFRLGSPVSAAAQSGAVIYTGTPDGRLAVSHDNGGKWGELSKPSGAAVTRIWVDGERPDSALAAVGTRLLRTVNGGLFWDDVTGALPTAQIHGIAADRSAGTVYVATDRGVFSGNVPLSDAGSAASPWKSVSADLPGSAAWDVRLNIDNTLTVALDGYGVFETAAPHRTRAVHVVNGADMSDRAAAPGSVISVLGAAVLQGKIGSAEYPVLAANDQSSQLQVPFEAQPGVFQIALEGATDRWTAPLTVKDASPAIFVVDQEGSPLILDSSSGLVMDPNIVVRAKSIVQILATGLGKVTPDWPTGVPAPADTPPAVKGKVTAWLDGTPIEVSRATLAPGYIGYYLVEIQIPAIVNRGASELRIVMNGEESNRVKLYLEPEAADSPAR